ncbi:hypothetical protein SAMN05216489_08356 [Streptomyces sp. 3213]|nr:hypothetical protein SAMN05216489_08356 [Streptomyces sp. 3213] [Streptomyces sp. 3213.3]
MSSGLLLAVDGGNSKTDIAVLTTDGTILGRARGGGFRPQAVGLDAAMDAPRDATRPPLPQVPRPHPATAQPAAAVSAPSALACVRQSDWFGLMPAQRSPSALRLDRSCAHSVSACVWM